MRITFATELLFASALRAAEPLRFSSGPSQVTLIELYTSEECGSCPPAGGWPGSLRGRSGPWTEFVPVEGTRRVYTPCFVRNGSEWRSLWGGSPVSANRGGVDRRQEC
jgi:hypothetical protein